MPTTLESMRIVAARLQAADVPFAFVGGAVVCVLVDDPTLTEIRPTKDVDDLEDIITLIDGRAAIVADVTDAPQPVRNYVAHWFREILGNSDFQDAFPGHLSALSRARAPLVLQRFQAIASL